MCLLTVWSTLVAATMYAGGNVHNTSVGFTPLDDLAAGTYQGAPGGLYPGGSNTMPAAHLADGITAAAQVQPRDANGAPSPTGKVGIVTLGMSNGALVFGLVEELLRGTWKPGVVFVNGAQGSMDAVIWTNRAHVAWSNMLARVAAAGLSTQQVQVALNYHAVAHMQSPPKPWPATPGDLQLCQELIAGHLHNAFPNMRIALWGTREYGGYAVGNNNPEPYAYQSAFAVKWMIERQINGDLTLNHDPLRGAVTVPWLAWGPYVWADGMRARCDGLRWEARDFQPDGTHPIIRGTIKQAGAWARLLRTEPCAASWAVPAGNLPPLCALLFPRSQSIIEMNGAIAIEAHAQDDDGGITSVEFLHGTTRLGVVSNAPYGLLWQPPGAGDYALSAVAHDDAGSSRTSQTVTARIRPPSSGVSVLASDSFESGDLLGGAGWTMPAWLSTGAVAVVLTNAADGLWCAQYSGAATLARALALNTPATAVLQFDWRGALASGSILSLDVRDTAWKLALSFTNTATAVWSRVTIPLTPYQASSSFGVRFSTTGNAVNLGLDNIRIISSELQTNTAPVLALPQYDTGHTLLEWQAQKFITYRVMSSTNMAAWSEIHAITTEESSRIGCPVDTTQKRAFLRVEAYGP